MSLATENVVKVTMSNTKYEIFINLLNAQARINQLVREIDSLAKEHIPVLKEQNSV